MLCWEKSHPDTIAWSPGMEGHANKRVERNCELANPKIKQLYKVSTPCSDDHQFKNEGLETVVVDLSNNCPQIVFELLLFGTHRQV